MDATKKSPSNRYDLELALPYLLNRAASEVVVAFSGELTRFNVSLSAWRVMASLLHRDGQTLSELAEHTSIDLSTLSRLAVGMQTQELLKRVQNGEDKRSVRIWLSSSGKKLVTQLVPLAELYERIALSGLTDEEVVALKALLGKVYSNLAAVRSRQRRVT